MSYSEIHDYVEDEGYEESFRYLYYQYNICLMRMKDEEERYLQAKANYSDSLTQIGHFIKKAATDKIIQAEGEGYCWRGIIEDKLVVTFKHQRDGVEVDQVRLTNYKKDNEEE